MTGKNCTNGNNNGQTQKSNVSKNGIPKKLPKRTSSQSRPDPTNVNGSEPLVNQNTGLGLELNSQGIQQIPNRSNSQVRGERPSVFKTNARDILNIMDDVRSIDQQIAQRVRIKKSSVTQRSNNGSQNTNTNNVTPNLSVGNSAISTNRTSRSRNSNFEDTTVDSSVNLSNSVSVSSTSHLNSTPRRSEPSFEQFTSQAQQNINYTNNLIDRNMDKIDALDSRNDNMNSKLNNNISEINDLLKEINEKLLSGTLDQDEKMV